MNDVPSREVMAMFGNLAPWWMRVMALIRDKKNVKVWSARLISEKLSAAGWSNLCDVPGSEPNLRNISAALSKLAKEGRLVRVSRGIYRKAPSKNE
jgi:predicted transcriptional regulator of viral defense system